jgi:hypothetical protein
MKKALHMLVLLMLLLPLGASAQTTFRIIFPNNHPSNNTFTVTQDPFEHYMSIQNLLSDETIAIKVQKIGSAYTGDDTTFICWGATCYPPTVSLTDTLMFPPNVTRNNIFSSTFRGFTTSSNSSVTYRFMRAEDDVTDFIDYSFNYNYTTGVTSITPVLNSRSEMANAMPNPAISTTSIPYSLAAPSTNARLKVYDLLGQEVRNIPLRSQNGSVQLDVNNLQNGIYFYSLVVDGRAVSTKRLIVNN